MIDVKQLVSNSFQRRNPAPLSCPPTSISRPGLLAIALLLLCPLIGHAQELTATLSGTVTDTSGAVIPHVSITINLSGVNGTARTVESDGAGNYTATNLPAGNYSVTAVATGFDTYNGQNIVLDVAEKHALNIQLKAGSTSTTVTAIRWSPAD